MEKIQMTGFCIQEFHHLRSIRVGKQSISSKHKIPSLEALRPHQIKNPKKSVSRVMLQLFTINVVIIVLDVALLVVEYYDLHIPEISLKPFFYSVKLKLEFAVLSKLVETSSSLNHTNRRSMEFHSRPIRGLKHRRHRSARPLCCRHWSGFRNRPNSQICEFTPPDDAVCHNVRIFSPAVDGGSREIRHHPGRHERRRSHKKGQSVVAVLTIRS